MFSSCCSRCSCRFLAAARRRPVPRKKLVLGHWVDFGASILPQARHESAETMYRISPDNEWSVTYFCPVEDAEGVVCRYVSESWSEAFDHMYRVHIEAEFRCRICGYRTSHANMFRIHVAHKHELSPYVDGASPPIPPSRHPWTTAAPKHSPYDEPTLLVGDYEGNGDAEYWRLA